MLFMIFRIECRLEVLQLYKRLTYIYIICISSYIAVQRLMFWLANIQQANCLADYADNLLFPQFMNALK